jgi:hypothetical protein
MRVENGALDCDFHARGAECFLSASRRRDIFYKYMILLIIFSILKQAASKAEQE